MGTPTTEAQFPSQGWHTFVEKLQAVVRKYRLYKESKQGANLPSNFIRHYYDLYQLIDRVEVQTFIGTPEYEAFKKERFGGDDTKVSNSDALKLTDPGDRAVFEKEYTRSESLYFKGQPTLTQILERMAKDMARLYRGLKDVQKRHLFLSQLP